MKPPQIYQADDDDKDCSGDVDDVDNPHPDWKGALQYPTKSTESARRQTELCFFSTPSFR